MIYLLQMVNQKSIIYFDAFANWTSVDNGFSHEFPIKTIEKLQFSHVFSRPPRPYRRRPSLQCSRAAHRTRPGPGGSSVAPTQWPCPFCTAPVERGGTAVWNANFHRMAGWWFEPYPSEKWWSSSVGVIVPNIWKNKKCSKPPTRWVCLKI